MIHFKVWICVYVYVYIYICTDSYFYIYTQITNCIHIYIYVYSCNIYRESCFLFNSLGQSFQVLTLELCTFEQIFWSISYGLWVFGKGFLQAKHDIGGSDIENQITSVNWNLWKSWKICSNGHGPSQHLFRFQVLCNVPSCMPGSQS